MVLLSSTTPSDSWGGSAISVTPEVTPIDKKKSKRSAKPKRETPPDVADSTIQGHPAPEPAPMVNGASENKPVYDWDRTPAEAAQKAEDERIRKTAFPQPTAKTLSHPEFCEYWNDLIKRPESKYARLFVRRWFPYLLPEEQETTSGMKREAFPSEETLKNDFGPLSEQTLLEKVGVGDYTIRLNDTRRPFDLATVVHCEKWITRRDFEHYPPQFDIPRLDWNNEGNRVYIKFAQSRGILRHDDDRQKDESDMANEQVVTQLLQQNKVLTDQVVNAKAAPPPSPPAVPVKTDSGDGGAVKAVADLAIAALNRASQPANGSDPMKMVEGIAGVVNTLMPKPDTSSSDLAKEVVKESAAANERVFKMQETAINELREQIRAKNEPVAVAPVVPPPPPPTLAQQFQEMETLMGAAKRIARGGGTAPEEEEHKPSSIDKWLDAAPIIAPVISQIIGGFFQMGTFALTTWQQVSYNAALAKNGSEPKPPTTMEKAPEPGKPLAPQGPTPTAEQQAQQIQWNTIMASIHALAPYLIDSLDDGESGAEFAEFIIKRAPEKRTSYERIKHLADSLTMIGIQVPGDSDLAKFTNATRYCFERIPNLWAKVGTLPTMSQFLAEFFNYDEILAEEEKRSATQTD